VARQPVFRHLFCEAAGISLRAAQALAGLRVCYNSGMNGPEKPPQKPQQGMRIIGVAGWSGSGKTTLITKVIPRLIARGLRVSTVKHAHHGFDIDRPGKDSFMHRTAGATEVLISSATRFALLHEIRDDGEWNLPELIAKLSPVDLVLVEGFKRDAFPKIEVYRADNGKPLLYPQDAHIAAVASDGPLRDSPLPVVDLNDVEAITGILLQHAIPIETAIAQVQSG
jgi:molybdopterin-guanine dinucleotide biosynthesis protein B